MRFPKFVFGDALTFGVFFALGASDPVVIPDLKNGTAQADVFRRLFFVLTFFSIWLATNARRLWAEGLGRLPLVYGVSLFGIVIWIGLAISWLFFHGVPAGQVRWRRRTNGRLTRTPRELAKVESEPLLLAENSLTGSSLALGVLLLGALLWVGQ